MKRKVNVIEEERDVTGTEMEATDRIDEKA